jgi:hypothetical protein
MKDVGGLLKAYSITKLQAERPSPYGLINEARHQCSFHSGIADPHIPRRQKATRHNKGTYMIVRIFSILLQRLH